MVNNPTAVEDLEKKNNPVNSAKGFSKEAEPIRTENNGINEIVEHKAEEEVQPFVSPRSETIELPPDLKKMGLKATSDSKYNTYENIKLPISDERIISGEQAPINTSIRWLATLAKYILAQAHIGLKVVHGKVVRVLRS